MHLLPEEITTKILDGIPPAERPVLMLVNKTWHRILQDVSYSTIDLDFYSTSRVARTNACVRTLAAPSSSMAKVVRHLTIRGLYKTTGGTVSGTDDDRGGAVATVARALQNTIRLVSLDIHIVTSPQQLFASELFPAELCNSPTFLPRLAALNVDDADIVSLLAPGRPICSIRVESTLVFQVYTSLATSVAKPPSLLRHLQVSVRVEAVINTIEFLRLVSENFPRLTHLGVMIDIVRRPDISSMVGWKSMKEILGEIGPILGCMHQLAAFSLVVFPETCIDKSENQELEAAKVLHRSAPFLQRIEVRWAGWIIDSGKWNAVPQGHLMRKHWLYKLPWGEPT